MKTVVIGSFSVIGEVRRRGILYNVQYVSPNNTKEENRKMVEEADSLIAIISKDFYLQHRNIGTKVEIKNNIEKVIILEWFSKTESFKRIVRLPGKLFINLPSWDDYVSH